MRDCSICNKPIVLKPTAKFRADKYGGTASQYTDLFREHAQCAINKRDSEARELMRSKRDM